MKMILKIIRAVADFCFGKDEEASIQSNVTPMRPLSELELIQPFNTAEIPTKYNAKEWMQNIIQHSEKHRLRKQKGFYPITSHVHA